MRDSTKQYTKSFYEIILKYRKIFFAILILFVLTSLFLRAFQHVSFARDSYWHLKIGLDFIEKGLSPYEDHYSIHHRGQGYGSAMPVLFQVVIATVHKVVGPDFSISTSLFLIFASITLCFLGVMNHLKVSLWLTSVGLIQAYLVLFSRPFLRPELGSHLFEILLIPFLVGCLKSWSRPKLAWISLFILIWSNYHASAIFGFLIVGAMYIELIIKELQERRFNQVVTLCVWGLFTLCLGYINHSLVNPVVASLLFPADWSKYIEEFISFKIYNSLMVGTYWIAALGSLLYVFKKEWAYLILSIVLTYSMWKVNRLYTHCGLILATIFIVSVQNSINQFSPIKLKLVQKYVPLILVLMGGLFFHYHLGALGGQRHLHVQQFPVRVADYIENNKKKGNIYNSYEDGGYFIYRNSPDLKVLIDGRTQILYSADFYKKHWYDTHFSPMAFYNEIQGSDLKFVSARSHSEVNVIELSLRTGVFDFEFADDYYTFLERRPLIWKIARELILYPGCVEKMPLGKIEKELEMISQSAGLNETYVFNILKMASDYLKAKDKKEFISRIRLPENFNIFEFRFFTQLLILNNLEQLALELYGQVNSDWVLERDLMLILSLLLNKKEPALENVRNTLLKLGQLKIKMTKKDRAIFIHLLDSYMKKSNDIKIITKETRDFLLSDIKQEFADTKDFSPKDIFSFGCGTETEFQFRSSNSSP